MTLDSGTCQGEPDTPLAVLFTHGCRQLARVDAAVAAGQVRQEEFPRVSQQLHAALQAHVEQRRAVRKLLGHQASEVRGRGLSYL